MKRILFTAAVIAALAIPSVVFAASTGGGNSADAKLCQENGWQTLAPSTSAPSFASQGACVAFGAHGGALVPYAADLRLYATYLSASYAIVTVVNDGPHDATNVQMLMDGSNDAGAFSANYVSTGWSFVTIGPMSRSDIFARASIAAGDSATVPLQESLGAGTISVSVWVSDQSDPNPVNDTVTVSLTAS